jgi:hypothetical protein
MSNCVTRFAGAVTWSGPRPVGGRLSKTWRDASVTFERFKQQRRLVILFGRQF